MKTDTKNSLRTSNSTAAHKIIHFQGERKASVTHLRICCTGENVSSKMLGYRRKSQCLMIGTIRQVSHEIIRSSSLEKFKITFDEMQERVVWRKLLHGVEIGPRGASMVWCGQRQNFMRAVNWGFI